MNQGSAIHDARSNDPVCGMQIDRRAPLDLDQTYSKLFRQDQRYCERPLWAAIATSFGSRAWRTAALGDRVARHIEVVIWLAIAVGMTLFVG